MIEADWPIQPYQVYRGLGWYKPHWQPRTVRVIARGVCGFRWFTVQVFSTSSIKIARERWQEPLQIVTRRHHGLCQSVDGMPWEIHAIADSAAYIEACIQWQLARLMP